MIASQTLVHENSFLGEIRNDTMLDRRNIEYDAEKEMEALNLLNAEILKELDINGEDSSLDTDADKNKENIKVYATKNSFTEDFNDNEFIDFIDNLSVTESLFEKNLDKINSLHSKKETTTNASYSNSNLQQTYNSSLYDSKKTSCSKVKSKFSDISEEDNNMNVEGYFANNAYLQNTNALCFNELKTNQYNQIEITGHNGSQYGSFMQNGSQNNCFYRHNQYYTIENNNSYKYYQQQVDINQYQNFNQKQNNFFCPESDQIQYNYNQNCNDYYPKQTNLYPQISLQNNQNFNYNSVFNENYYSPYNYTTHYQNYSQKYIPNQVYQNQYKQNNDSISKSQNFFDNNVNNHVNNKFLIIGNQNKNFTIDEEKSTMEVNSLILYFKELEKEITNVSNTSLNYNNLIHSFSILSKNQNGCRFLQEKIEQKAFYDKILIPGLLLHFSDVSCNVYGNFLAQKIIEKSDSREFKKILIEVSPCNFFIFFSL